METKKQYTYPDVQVLQIAILTSLHKHKYRLSEIVVEGDKSSLLSEIAHEISGRIVNLLKITDEVMQEEHMKSDPAQS
jgi:hypothetical protein